MVLIECVECGDEWMEEIEESSGGVVLWEVSRFTRTAAL